jgi:hypothetical protein
MPAELVEDRRKMRPDLSIDTLKAAMPDCRNALRSACDHLERTFAQHDFVLGSSFSLADAAVYHNLWFVRNDAKSAALLASMPRLTAWMQRLEAMGNGKPAPMSADDALAIARETRPRTDRRTDPSDPNGLAPGARIGICSDDLPSDVFEGEVLAASAQEIVILRKDRDLGEIAQHFPRAGYLIRPLS